jgi:hypothetical protein
MPSGRSTRPAALVEQQGDQPQGNTEAARTRRVERLKEQGHDDPGPGTDLEATQADPAATPTPGQLVTQAEAERAEVEQAAAQVAAEVADADAHVKRLTDLAALPRMRRHAQQHLVDATNAERLADMLAEAKLAMEDGQLVDAEWFHRLTALAARWSSGRNIEAA